MTKISRVYPSGQAPSAPLSPAVQAGQMVFVSGQIPRDPKTGETVGTSVGEQTRQVLANLEMVLKAGGSSLEAVVKTTVFLTDIADMTEMNGVYKGAFASVLPARSTVQVAALGSPEFRVEIEAIAMSAE